MQASAKMWVAVRSPSSSGVLPARRGFGPMERAPPGQRFVARPKVAERMRLFWRSESRFSGAPAVRGSEPARRLAARSEQARPPSQRAWLPRRPPKDGRPELKVVGEFMLWEVDPSLPEYGWTNHFNLDDPRRHGVRKSWLWELRAVIAGWTGKLTFTSASQACGAERSMPA